MMNPVNLKRCLLWFLAVAFFCVFAGPLMAGKQDKKKENQKTAQTVAPTIAGATYVGSDTCKNCHEQQFKEIDSSPHFKTFAAQGRGQAWHGCESCHGPGSLHVEGGGDVSKILNLKAMSPEQVTSTCMQCHETSMEHINFNRSDHFRNGVGCTTCHSVHQAKESQYLLKAKSPELCYQCHLQIKADFVKPYRHRVDEGLITCNDCHNPHGSTVPFQLRTSPNQSAVCFKCHSDKQGPFVFEHEVVKVEGCTACHTPHGSTNPRLLKRATVNSMCLECHAGIPNGPHPQNAKAQACILCHASIHGSNTSEFFFR